MTIQATQIQSLEQSLYQDSSAPSSSNTSFQQYLEKEQQRIGSFFSPFNQFDFSAWFAYPDQAFNGNTSSVKIDLFSDIKMPPHINYETNNQNTTPSQVNIPSQTYGQTTNNYNANTPQNMLQDILTRNGWLIPNLEMQPLLLQAQMDGILLSKLDLQFLIDEIISHIAMVKEKGKTELSLGLRPDNLGEIFMTLTAKSGMISIQIQAPEETRKLLQSNLTELELALKKAKINLDKIMIVEMKGVDKNA